MRTWIAAACLITAAALGCTRDDKLKHDHEMVHKKAATTQAADACPHCAGVQKAAADGSCDKCGMKAS